MTRHLVNITTGMLLCAVIVFVLLPGLSLYLDECHPHRDPRCPFCTILLNYSAVVGLAAVVFLLACQRRGAVTLPSVASWRCAEKVGLPVIRGPPLLALSLPAR